MQEVFKMSNKALHGSISVCSSKVSVLRSVTPSQNKTAQDDSDGYTTENVGCCGCSSSRGPAVLKGASKLLPKNSLMEFFKAKIATKQIDPESTAIIFDNLSQLSYKDLDDISNNLALVIQSKLGKDTNVYNLDNDIVIAMCVPPSLKMHVPLIFAILKLGATYFPISNQYSEEKIFELVDEVKPVMIIISASDTETTRKFESVTLMNAGGIVADYEELITTNITESDNNPAVNILRGKDVFYPTAMNRAAILIAASNREGVYTGIRYQSRAILNWIFWERKEFPYEKDETILSTFGDSPDCVEAIKEIFSPLLSGGTLVILQQGSLSHPTVILEKIQTYRIRRVVVWPRFLRNILWTMEILGKDSVNCLLESVKYYFCVGDAITVELATMFYHYIHPSKTLVSLYGQKENLSAVAFQVYDSLESVEQLDYLNNLPVGGPIINTSLYIMDPWMNLVRSGVVGEICISSLQLSGDQHCKFEATRFNFSKTSCAKSGRFPHLLQTGDYGRIVKYKDGQKRLVYVHTSGNHIHIDEHYFNLKEITSHLKQMETILKDYHVMSYQVGNDAQVVIAFCCLKNPSYLKPLKSNLKSKLPAFAVPDVVVVEQETIALEASSTDICKKVNNKFLLRIYAAERKKRKEYSNWKNDKINSPDELKAERLLLLIISNLMCVPVKDMAENLTSPFSKFGGTNFKSVMIIRELHKVGYPITIDDFLKSNSLLEIIQKMVDIRAAYGIVELDMHAVKVIDSYSMEITTNKDKDEFIRMLCDCMTTKDELEYYSRVKPRELKKFLEKQWPYFIAQSLSLTVRRLKDKKIVGGVLSINLADRKDYRGEHDAISHRLELQRYLEGGLQPEVVTKSHKGKEVNTADSKKTDTLAVVYFGVLDNLFCLEELYEITHKLLRDVIKLAASRNFLSILITVSDFYLAELCEQELGFVLVRGCQANSFVCKNKSLPYSLAPDWLECKLMKKKL